MKYAARSMYNVQVCTMLSARRVVRIARILWTMSRLPNGVEELPAPVSGLDNEEARVQADIAHIRGEMDVDILVTGHTHKNEVIQSDKS